MQGPRVSLVARTANMHHHSDVNRMRSKREGDDDVTHKAETTTGLMVRVPPDCREWLKEQAKRNVSSQNAEIVRAVRERMQREAAR